MFGLSIGEVVLLAIVAIVVVGPRQLPTLLRTLGQLIGQARRLTVDLRAQSGIDEVLRAEGIQSEIENFRRLASGAVPFESVDSLLKDAPAAAKPAPDAGLPPGDPYAEAVADASSPAAAAGSAAPAEQAAHQPTEPNG